MYAALILLDAVCLRFCASDSSLDIGMLQICICILYYFVHNVKKLKQLVVINPSIVAKFVQSHFACPAAA